MIFISIVHDYICFPFCLYVMSICVYKICTRSCKLIVMPICITVKHLNEAQCFAQCCLKATGFWKPLSVNCNKSVSI